MDNFPKIVFILATHSNTNNIKRVEEFIKKGCQVEVYSFSRGGDAKVSQLFNVSIIGEFSNDLPYLRRIRLMWKALKGVLRKTKDENCIYYLIRNDVALLYSFMSNKPYIFEEADMTHANIKNKFVRLYMENRIKTIIKKSIVSVFRSEGFIKYHFGEKRPNNVFVIPNKLNPTILTLPPIEKSDIDINHLRFGFVGVIRHSSILIFSKLLMSKYPQHEMHFYGIYGTEKERQEYSVLNDFPNFYFHGKFVSPNDLPAIYSKIDIVLSTYDTSGVNARYLEPNKLYESIYFETPIIVSSETYLSDIVNKFNIGYSINTKNEESINRFLENLSLENLLEKKYYLRQIEKNKCINDNYEFFDYLKEKLSEIENK